MVTEKYSLPQLQEADQTKQSFACNAAYFT